MASKRFCLAVHQRETEPPYNANGFTFYGLGVGGSGSDLGSKCVSNHVPNLTIPMVQTLMGGFRVYYCYPSRRKFDNVDGFIFRGFGVGGVRVY